MDPLYSAIGRAVSAWAKVEMELARWFCEISGIPGLMAKDIFFAPNSFSGRVTLLGGALKNSTSEPERLQFVAAALAKCVTYSGFRNTLIHGIPLTYVPRKGPAIGVIIEPTGIIDESKMENGATADRLLTAAKCFDDLATIMAMAHEAVSTGPVPGQLAGLQTQLERLASQPWSAQVSRRQKGRERQLRAAARSPIPKRSNGKGS